MKFSLAKSLTAITLLSPWALTNCNYLEQTKLAYEAESACGFVQNSYGQRISWKHTLPVKIYISKSWPIQFLADAQSAADKWNAALNHPIIEIVDNSITISDTPVADKKNGLYFMTSWPAEKNLIQGITNLYYSGDQANDADIRINGKDFVYYSYVPQPSHQVHMESLLIHEMGHLLGLKHYQDPPTVMDPLLPYDFTRDTITPSDQQSLNCEYSS